MSQDIQYKFYYWGPYLWKSTLPEDFCDELLRRGNNAKVKFNDNLASIIDKVIAYDNADKEFFIKNTAPYFDTYLQSKTNYAKIEKPFPTLEMHGMWINYQKAGEFNPEHIHSGDLSFVVYLNVPEGIQKENDDYIGTSSGPGCILFRYGEQCDWAVSHQEFIPKKGDLYIFPASLSHSAYPFYSEGVRISMSGNFKFIYE